MTDTGRTRAERALAAVMAEMHPGWDEHGCLVTLRKLSERPFVEVSAAAIHVAALRGDQRTPDCLTRDGEHWQALARLANRPEVVPTYTPPGDQDRACPIHGDYASHCRGCAADAKACDADETTRPAPAPAATPDAIRAIRAEYRTEEDTNA